MWLTYTNQAVANTNEPAQTPTNNHYWEIITNGFEGSQPQIFQSVLNDNLYECNGALTCNTEPDPNSTTWIPLITVDDVKNLISQPYGAARWEGHAGTVGLAVEMFSNTENGRIAREARWDVLTRGLNNEVQLV